MFLASSLSYVCSHIQREGNHVANALAYNGQSLAPFLSQWWDSPLLTLLKKLYLFQLVHNKRPTHTRLSTTIIITTTSIIINFSAVPCLQNNSFIELIK